jgi:hypothetical protein
MYLIEDKKDLNKLFDAWDKEPGYPSGACRNSFINIEIGISQLTERALDRGYVVMIKQSDCLSQIKFISRLMKFK